MENKHIKILTVIHLACSNCQSSDDGSNVLSLEDDTPSEGLAFAERAGWKLDLLEDIALCPNCVDEEKTR